LRDRLRQKLEKMVLDITPAEEAPIEDAEIVEGGANE
jgi:hypothetical protein